MASPYDIDVRSEPYRAVGDGITDDTHAFRRAIKEATHRSQTGSGARIYVPPGKYLLFSDDAERGRPLRIVASNITLFGDGPQSTLYIAPPWKRQVQQDGPTPGDPDSYAYFEIGNRDGEPIENVHVRGLRIQSDATLYHEKVQRWVHENLLYDPSQLFMMGVPHTPTGVVSNSGFSEILAENLAGVVFAFNGGSNVNEGEQSRNNYVLHNRVLGCCLQAVNPVSGGHAGTLVAHNVIDGNAGLAIEWSSSFALIANNIIRRARGGAFAFDNGVPPGTENPEREGGVRAVDGWILFTNNTIVECGEGFGGVVSPSIYGEPAAYRRVMISNNAIQRAYGGGIVLSGADGSSEVVIHNNVIDGFGIDGKLLVDGRPRTTEKGWAGIHAVGKRRVVVTANVVRAGTGTDDRSEYGIVTGGSNAEDCWTDGNITIGARDGQPAFPRGAIRQSDWGSPRPGDLPTVTADSPRGRVKTGHNVNLETGKPAAKEDRTNSAHVPIFQTGDERPSVAGSNTWRVYPPPGGDLEIKELRDGYPGQIVTIVFYKAGSGRTHLRPEHFQLAEGRVFTSGDYPSTLVLICDTVDKPATGYYVITDPARPPDFVPPPLLPGEDPPPAPSPLALGEAVIPVWRKPLPGEAFTPPFGVGDTVSFHGQTQTYAVTAAALGPTGGSFTIAPALQTTAEHAELVTYGPTSNWIELSRSGDLRA